MIKDKDFSIEIHEENPLDNDQLHRENSLKMFSRIISLFPGNNTIAICAPYGMGKSVFVKMLQYSLQKKGHRTHYFNAWESDFSEDPLLALFSGMPFVHENREKFFHLLGNLGIDGVKGLTKGVVKALANGLLKKVTGTEGAEIIQEISNEISENLADFGKESLKEYESKKTSINQFREKLSEELDETKSELPLIFFIDELDRCNPAYAVKTLERVKHLFNIPGIVFVMSIDEEQLENSIKGYFSSENFNAKEYLRRFIDVSYSLPEPNYGDYIDYVGRKLGIERDLNNEGSRAYSDFIDILKGYAQAEHLSLRQIEKLLIHISIITSSFTCGGIIEYVAFFTFLSFYKPEIMRKLKNKELDDLRTLINELGDLFFRFNDDNAFFMGQIIGLYGYFSGVFDMKEVEDLAKVNDLNLSEDCQMQLIAGIKRTYNATMIPTFENILNQIYLYSTITKK